MNKKYNLKLDLQFRCNNSIMKFNQFDNNTSDFFMRITNGGNLVDIEKAIVVLAIIKPSGKVASQFVEVKNDVIYADLKPNMKNEIGIYTAQAMLILEDERVVTDSISYEVEEDKIFSLLNDTVGTSEEFTLLTDMLSRLSAIEISEEQRVINEAERILSEENRKIEEAKRVEAELIRQHEEADRSKYDATRESNENIRKQNESIRLANEANRIDEEAKRVEEEANRVEAEQLRKDNYNFMTEDEERRRSEANAHKEAEKLRAQAETNRVNEEAKRRTTEQTRISAENTRVSNESARKANETTRQTNETHRVEAETQRQNRYNSFIADAEINANNFENYTNSAKIKEEERKSNELNRKSQEDRRVSNEVERISNENTRKANEVAREKNETSRQYVFENKVNEVDKKIVELNTTKDNFVSNINTKVDTKISEIDNVKDNFVSSISTKVDNKISELDSAKSDMTNTVSNKVNEVENRFNALTSKQQQDAEVIDARDGEISLKARLDRDIEKAKQVYVNVEGSHISTDSSVGYLKDVEILGNTIQSASNLADIRSVGDKVEGQELYEIPVLSRGKNLFNTVFKDALNNINGVTVNDSGVVTINGTFSTHAMFNVVIPKGKYRTTTFSDSRMALHVFWDGGDSSFQTNKTLSYTEDRTLKCYIASGTYDNHICKFQLEEGTVATPYEPYQEDKLTILSPVQPEKVGDVPDRIIEKDGVWGVEKNVKTVYTKEFASLIGTYEDKGGTYKWGLNLDTPKTLLLTNFLQIGILSAESTQTQVIIHNHGAHRELRFAFKKSDFPNFDVKSNVVDYLSDETRFIKIVQQPQFIPLPHDQQVKLRTFANKTNISFGCEIEGTIKAQVPKSLGATVNTHTEQINNLNKELDRVKKLEESTVSTVTTESDFTTVEATSNGYFDDVKLEGKTLVNIVTTYNTSKFSFKEAIKQEDGCYKLQYGATVNDSNVIPRRGVHLYKPNTTYTIIVDIKENTTGTLLGISAINSCIDPKTISERNFANLTGISTITFKTRDDITISDKGVPPTYDLYFGIWKDGGDLSKHITFKYWVLEGDHTQNPPSYFEGLKSVCQSATTSENGVDEIVVSSVKGDGNLLMPLHTGVTPGSYNKNNITFSSDYSMSYVANAWGQGVSVDVIGVVKGETYVVLCDAIRAGCIRGSKALTTSSDVSLASTRVEIVATSTGIGTITFKNTIETGDISFTNLRVVKKGSKEEFSVLNQDKKRLLYYNEETQSWEKPILREWDSIEKHSDGKYYYHVRSKEGDYVEGDESLNDCITDLTVSVKKLAEEKVYECTNIDLITYNGETNFIVESGVLSPRTTLKVHNNISNVVSLLQKKVSLLESNVTSYMITQNRLMLASRYNADNVTFKVDYPSMMSEREVEIDYDLFKLIQDNIIVGPENYDVDKMLEIMDLYAMIGFITWEMWDYLYEVIDIQINPVIGDLEGAPEI